MIWRLDHLHGYSIRATDGELGSVKNLLFDDQSWTVRYLVVDTGTWLSGRSVLIVPSAFGRPDPGRNELPVSMTKQQVKDSPDIDTDKPVSRQQETRLHSYFGWTPYWATSAMFGAVPPPAGVGGYPAGTTPPVEPAETEVERSDPHLRSANEVDGYYIQARDGDIGHLEDFLVDTDAWRIRYLLVDTRNWLPGRKVVISPDWAHRIDWNDRKVHVDLPRDQIERSPDYDPAINLDRRYEEELHSHYGRAPYWTPV